MQTACGNLSAVTPQPQFPSTNGPSLVPQGSQQNIIILHTSDELRSPTGRPELAEYKQDVQSDHQTLTSF